MGFILLPLLLMLSGCYKWHHVEGNYNVETENRQLPDFKEVHNEGEFDVYIIQDGLSEVEIEAESNLIPLIRTRIEGSALVIDTKDDLDPNFSMNVYVHTGEIREIRLSGSGKVEADSIVTEDIDIDLSGSGYMFFGGTGDFVDCKLSGSGDIDLDLECNTLEADISGSGSINVTGTADEGDFGISGSGSINAYELILQECHAGISGSGSMYLTVEDHLYVDISGSGSVFYLGTPSVDTHITGSGSVIHP
jgi:hypothetical protein